MYELKIYRFKFFMKMMIKRSGLDQNLDYFISTEPKMKLSRLRQIQNYFNLKSQPLQREKAGNYGLGQRRVWEKSQPVLVILLLYLSKNQVSIQSYQTRSMI